MRSYHVYSFVLAAGVGLLLACSSGCGWDRGYNRYVPPEEAARQALERALTAWQKGRSPGQVDDGPPAVQVVDSRWQAGQKLNRYEIVKEEPGDNGTTFYSVRLTLQCPAQEQVVRYVVVGRDPLWVYREEDFTQQTKGM
jgi:hypothetical protein